MRGPPLPSCWWCRGAGVLLPCCSRMAASAVLATGGTDAAAAAASRHRKCTVCRCPTFSLPPPLALSSHAPAVKRKTRKALGRILLKGDTITLMQAAK